jgi:hypothetical protein
LRPCRACDPGVERELLEKLTGPKPEKKADPAPSAEETHE